MTKARPEPSRRVFDHIPGLFLYSDYFSLDRCSLLIRGSLDHHERLCAQLGQGPDLHQATIPQPAWVRSAEHNLKSEEHYARLPLTEPTGRRIRCEFFPRYGEDGHALCYFQGAGNLPDLIGEELLSQVHTTVSAAGLLPAGRSLVWKLTMNFYKSVEGQVAGFPFHVDIPSNGVVTMILNIHQEALFQIAKDDAVTDVTLPIGGLLILSGESRYEWKHRVLPRPSAKMGRLDEVERISLVLGFQ